MQIIYFQLKDFYVPFMTLQSIAFKFFAIIMKVVVFFVVQVVLVLTLQVALRPNQIMSKLLILIIFFQ